MQSIFSVERVVTLLTPLFAALATWIAALVATHVPGAPNLDHDSLMGVEIAAFLGTVGIVAKWLHGRQVPSIAGLRPTPAQLAHLYREVDAYVAEHATRLPSRDEVLAEVEKYIDATFAAHTPTLPQLDTEAIVNTVLDRIRSGLGPPGPAGDPAGASPAV